MKRKMVCISMWLLLVLGGAGALADGPVIYATWDDFEVDKLASIWLLKRFISPGAHIEIHPKGEIIKRGIAFDTPYAALGRRFNKSAFEVLIGHYGIKDEKLIKLSRIIHDIEINVWQRKRFEESMQIDQDLWFIIESSGSPEALIEASCTYFDELYEKMKKQVK